jgi:hypothetical protein
MKTQTLISYEMFLKVKKNQTSMEYNVLNLKT